MADFDMSRINTKKGRIEVEGRTFQIEFWDDKYFELPWVAVSEIIVKEAKSHWFSRKTVMRETEHCIDSGWMDGNRLEWAMQRITKYLQKEKDGIEELRQIEAFCSMKD